VRPTTVLRFKKRCENRCTSQGRKYETGTRNYSKHNGPHFKPNESVQPQLYTQLQTHIFMPSRFPSAALKLPTPMSVENPSLAGFSIDSETPPFDTDSALSLPASRATQSTRDKDEEDGDTGYMQAERKAGKE
jgi:hypothetical protein